MMINVLVAEDEPLILNSITKLIHSLDSDFIVCARAKNGLEVLQCLNSQPINIIFTDIKMPLLNGLDLIQEIRNRSLNVPIVILSGYNDFSYAKKALKLGVFDYLLKPIDPEELSNTLGKLKQLYAKHYRLTYYGDGRYKTTIAKTGSDWREGKNIASVILKSMM